MLKGLDAIDWAALNSDEVLDLTRKFLSELPESRNKVLSKLFYLMGSGLDRSNVTLYIIPFLLAILSSIKWTEEKQRILAMLWALANTYDEKTITAEFKGIPAYIGLLNDPDSAIRVNAAQLLCFFHEVADQLFPYLIAQVNIEDDIAVKAAIIWNTGWLLDENQELNALQKSDLIWQLTAELDSSEDKLVRLAAAISLVRIMGAFAPANVDGELIEGIAHPSSYPKFQYIDDFDHPGWYTTYDALWAVGEERSLSGFEQALNLASTPLVAHSIAIELLNHAFESDSYLIFDNLFFHDSNSTQRNDSGFLQYPIVGSVDADNLTREQIRAVHAVLNCDNVWKIHNNLLELYGLPASREMARAHLLDSQRFDQ